MGKVRDSWGFAEGDAITADLTAVRLLGGGEAYEAYLAFDEITYAPVVVKVLRPGQVEDAAGLRGLHREIGSLDRVNHPSVVRRLRSETAGDRPHVVLEQVDGPRLSSLVRRHGPLPEQQYLPLAVEMCSALHYLHRVGLVHLDVKPSNIIMGAPAKLIDLSVARPVETARALTYPIGTDAYMAPEQVDPPRTGRPGPASDMWGLGATLFKAIAGYRAFDDPADDVSDATGSLGQRFPQLVDLPWSLPGHVPEDVAKLVYACLEPDPANRPLPRELAEGLEPALARAPRGRLAGFRVR